MVEEINCFKVQCFSRFYKSVAPRFGKDQHPESFNFEFIALMIEGVEIAERSLIVVLGITHDFQKVPLGIREGDTENSTVIKDLLASIRDRNFKMHTDRILAVTDGANAIKKALKDIFADQVVVQRCWLHKLRNLQKYVPENLHRQLWWRIKQLMNLKSFEDAKKDLVYVWADGVNVQVRLGEDKLANDILGLTRT